MQRSMTDWVSIASLNLGSRLLLLKRCQFSVPQSIERGSYKMIAEGGCLCCFLLMTIFSVLRNSIRNMFARILAASASTRMRQVGLSSARAVQLHQFNKRVFLSLGIYWRRLK